MKFRSIVETSGIGISTIDINGSFVSVNPALLDMLGYTEEEFLKQSLSSITHPDDIAKNSVLFKEMWEGRLGSYTLEKRDRHKDGHYIWGRITASIVRDGNGNPQFAIAMFEDITAARHAEQVQKAIFNIAQAVTDTPSLDGLYESIHTILAEMMPVDNFYIALLDTGDGLIHFPFVRDQFDPSTTPIEPDKTLTYYTVKKQTPMLINGEAFDRLVKEGDVMLVGARPAEWLGAPLIINDEAAGVMVTQHYDEKFRFDKADIELFTFVSTQVAQAIAKKRTEEALIRSDADMRALFAAMTDIVLVLDEKGRYQKIVGTNTNLLYRPPKELLGKTLHEVFDADQADIFLKHIRSTLQTRKKATFEYPLKVRGRNLWFAATLSTVTDDSVIWVAHDITPRKKAEEALRLNEARYHTLFEYSPISLWEGDFSAVKRFITDLKRTGVSDFRTYFEDHPEEFRKCTSLVRIIDVNEAALRLVHAHSKEELIANYGRIFDWETQKDTYQEFVEKIAGTSDFDMETLCRTIDGEKISISFHWSFGVGFEESLKKVITAIEDITPRKQAEEELRFRYNCEEKLTAISTRFINVPTSGMDREIDGALETIGRLENLDRCCLYHVDEEKQVIIISHEWCEDGVPPVKHSSRPISISGLSNATNRSMLKPVIYRSIDDFSENAVIERTNFVLHGIRSSATIPMLVNQKLIGLVGFESIHAARDWDEEDMLMMQQFTNILSNAIERSRLIDELKDRAIRDEMTGIFNRRGFFEFAKVELGRASRFHRPTAVFLFDVDNLKKVNDTYGHLMGDRVIQEVVNCARKHIRQIDLFGRWGGDEFMILLPEVDLSSAQQIAERLRDDLQKDPFLIENQSVPITISIGVAASEKSEVKLDDLFRQADLALYSAKNSGKNCVCIDQLIDR